MNEQKEVKPSAYIIGKYYKHDDDVDRLEGVGEGDIYLVMENTPENIAHAKELVNNYKPKTL